MELFQDLGNRPLVMMILKDVLNIQKLGGYR
mgnify:CR=1 FL=1